LYFPQILTWFDEVDSALVGVLLERWPTLEALQKARSATLRSFFTQHNCRRAELIEQRLEQICQAVPAIRDAAVIQSAVAMVSVLVHLIGTLRDGIAALDRQIEQAVAVHPDFAIFDSFPGAGPVLAPRLLLPLARNGTDIDRRPKYSGIAPVLVRSGKTAWVHYRWACPKFPRQTFQEWAGHSIGFCDWARAYYQQQRKRGVGHHVAVRALAFKWIRIAFRCWKDRVPYDDSRYLQSLRPRGVAARLRRPSGTRRLKNFHQENS
jgi:hypothetical protein